MPNERLVVPDLYDKIDLQYYSNQKGFKYAFVIKAGGDPSKISHKFIGATSSSIDANGTLNVNSSIGSIALECHAYQLDNSNNVIPLNWNIEWNQVQTNFFNFDLGAYDASKTLILTVDRNVLACNAQPSYKNIRHSSFFGGGHQDFLSSNCTDYVGNVYYAGGSSSVNFPTNIGPANVSGDMSATITKFNSYGTRKWATFVRGNSHDEFYGITTNTSSQPIAVGQSYSADYPIQHTGNQYYQLGGNAGGYDGIITKLDSNGINNLWSAFFGSVAASESLNKIVSTPNGTFVVGFGTETTPHITKQGAYNSPTTPSGVKGVIAHFDNNDSLVWSTFIGKNIKGVHNFNNSVALCGEITTNDLPYKYLGTQYIDSTLNGTSDAFFVNLNQNDSIDWATYFGGNSTEICNAIKFDNNGNLFGTGKAGAGFYCKDPGNGAYFDDTYSALGDAVMWKFNDKFNLTWSSYFGNSSTYALKEDNGQSIAIDQYNNIYFCGTSLSQLENIGYGSGTNAWYTQNYTSTSSDYQEYIFAVANNLNPFWATRFGGAAGNYNNGIAVDTIYHYLYLVGTTSTLSNVTPQNFPTYKPTNFTGWYRCENASPGLFDGYFAQFNITNGVLAGISEHEITNISNLLAYPNPFNNDITFNFNVDDTKGYTLEIYNALGQTVYTEKEKNAFVKVNKTINLPSINQGMYFVNIRLSNKTLTAKLIKQ
jgi:hypothetical protein